MVYKLGNLAVAEVRIPDAWKYSDFLTAYKGKGGQMKVDPFSDQTLVVQPVKNPASAIQRALVLRSFALEDPA